VTDQHGLNKNIRVNPSDPCLSVVHSDPCQSVVNCDSVAFTIVGEGYAPWLPGFDPEHGTVKGAVVTCPVCGATIDAGTTRRLFRAGRAGQRMVAVVTTGVGAHGSASSGKTYRLPTADDLKPTTSPKPRCLRYASACALPGGWNPCRMSRFPLVNMKWIVSQCMV